MRSGQFIPTYYMATFQINNTNFQIKKVCYMSPQSEIRDKPVTYVRNQLSGSVIQFSGQGTKIDCRMLQLTSQNQVFQRTMFYYLI